jgi:hypothetical protein
VSFVTLPGEAGDIRVNRRHVSLVAIILAGPPEGPKFPVVDQCQIYLISHPISIRLSPHEVAKTIGKMASFEGPKGTFWVSQEYVTLVGTPMLEGGVVAVGRCVLYTPIGRVEAYDDPGTAAQKLDAAADDLHVDLLRGN